jgi:hypothetical protein
MRESHCNTGIDVDGIARLEATLLPFFFFR